jgi:hypothetical protein
MTDYSWEAWQIKKQNYKLNNNNMDKKYGILTSSVDNNELSMTITNIAKVVGTVLSAVVALQGTSAMITNDQVEAVVNAIIVGGTGLIAVYQSSLIVYGIFRKIIVKYYKV